VTRADAIGPEYSSQRHAEIKKIKHDIVIAQQEKIIMSIEFTKFKSEKHFP
jgi:hypothetical protein